MGGILIELINHALLCSCTLYTVHCVFGQHEIDVQSGLSAQMKPACG